MDSYEYERRQVVVVNSQQSLKNGKQIFNLLKAAGTADPDASKAFRNLYRNIENLTALDKIKEGIQDQREHFDNLGLHIGYVYGDQTNPQNASTYKPSRAPGARLPHTWIKLSWTEFVDQPALDFFYLPCDPPPGELSTLDLCPHDAFTLIANEAMTSNWHICLRELRELLPASVATTLKIRLAVRDRDFEIQRDRWTWDKILRQCQSLLVHPDQHILACLSGPISSVDIFRALKEHLAW